MYKLKEGVNLPKEFKIKVNPEQSEALQFHLLSVGVLSINGQDGGIGYLDMSFFYCRISFDVRQMSADYYNKSSEQKFKNYRLPKIKFKDYFEKVTNQFPEKWCIEVTEDNCNELNVWMHRNWKNYPSYKDDWKVYYDCRYFYSEEVRRCLHSSISLIEGFTIITTEQFRKQFGIVNINETEIKAMESNIDFWHERANYHKQRCKYLRLERYEMSKEIEQLKSELALYNSLKETLILIAKKD